MDPKILLQLVESLRLEKNIDRELIFQTVESALVSAAKKHYGEESIIEFHIDRENGETTGSCNGEPLDFAETIGRIGAQTAKQVIIQKLREAERDALLEEYQAMIGQMVSGVVQRAEGGATTVQITNNVEAILPRSEQIPGETHHANERVRAVVYEVRPQGSRVKIVLSRTRPQFVQRLFEQEIPEISDGVITINAMAREPGYRTKVAVSSTDQRVDCVGACVGVRGNRIKNIVDELAGERIDIVRWSDDPQVLIPNALQPAEVDEVILCQMMGRAIVLVREDQLSLAIGRRGQNVRLASKLCVWDIEIMTQEELEEQIDRAVTGFSALEGVTEDLANRLVGEGYLSYDDLSVIEPSDLIAMGELTEEQADKIVEEAERRALEAEEAAAAERRRQREQERIAAADRAEQEAEAAAKAAAGETAAAAPTESPAAETPAGEETAAEEAPSASSAETESSEQAASQEVAHSDSTVSPDQSESSAEAESVTAESARDGGQRGDGAESESSETESSEAQKTSSD
jgi:N utilization substance protein A